MAPTPAIPPQVTSPSSSKARLPTPARSTKTASPLQKQSSSSPSPATIKRGGASLAEHQAATVLQCWKRRIWLRRWFDQQALLKQKRLRLQALCRGASAYASLVWGYVVHLQPRPKRPPTRRYQTIPSAIMASRYHRGRGADDTNARVLAQVKGTGPVLPILEGSRRICPLSFGLHKLWQRLLY